MNQYYGILMLFNIIFSCHSINSMHKQKLIEKEVIYSQNETLVILQKEKTQSKHLTLVHRTDSITQEQSWTGYLQLLISERYIAHYKYNPEAARRKWEKLNRLQGP